VQVLMQAVLEPENGGKKTWNLSCGVLNLQLAIECREARNRPPSN